MQEIDKVAEIHQTPTTHDQIHILCLCTVIQVVKNQLQERFEAAVTAKSCVMF